MVITRIIRESADQQAQDYADHLMELFGISHVRDKYPAEISGGERQKLAIARAIYKDAPFVIMDEPTAALDPISECDVYESFDRLVGHKAAVYISHRLASCRFCDKILVFSEGGVVQNGSHEALVEQKGLYREMWNAQAQWYAETAEG